MPIYLSARGATLAAKACRDAAHEYERSASRMPRGGSVALDYEGRAKQFLALAALFEKHASTPANARHLSRR